MVVELVATADDVSLSDDADVVLHILVDDGVLECDFSLMGGRGGGFSFSFPRNKKSSFSKLGSHTNTTTDV